MRNRFLKKGFTLIELIIVIAILGLLAVGLLVAIDPIEQTNRAIDAGVESQSKEYLNALNRFYTQALQYPTSLTAGPASGMSLTDLRAVTSIQNLTAAGELKTTFTTYNRLANIFVTLTSTNSVTSAIVCMSSVSRSFRNNPEASNNISGAALAGCPNGANPNCALCFR